MTKLPYSNNADLIAAFNAGVKFLVKRGANEYAVTSITKHPHSSSRTRVQTIETVWGYGEFAPTGVNGNDNELTLEFDLDYPALPFATWAEAEAAFKAGTKFTVINDGKAGAVTSLRVSGSSATIYADNELGSWTAFSLDGRNRFYSKLSETDNGPTRLIVNGPVVTETPKPAAKLPDSWPFPPAKAAPKPITPEDFLVKTAAPVAPVNQPLLKRFLSGESFYNPKTREVLESFEFKKGQLVVTLKNPETGAMRTTPRYNHEGVHKFRPERNLVAGTPPKPKRKVKIAIYKHAYNGSLFVIRDGEVIPNIRGISNATLVGNTTIEE